MSKSRDNTSAKVEAQPRNPLHKFTSYVRLLTYAQPTIVDYGLLIIALTAAVVSGVPLPLLAILFGQLINDLNIASCNADILEADNSSYEKDINQRILILVYIAIAQFVFIYAHLVCWSLVGSRLAHRIRERYLKNLLRQEPSFFDDFNKGEVSSRLNGDIQTIRSGTSEKVGICITTVSCLVGAYVVAFIKYPKLAGILTCLIPAYLLMSLGGNYFIEKYSGQLSDHVATASSIASEALSHVAVVHAFGASGRLGASMSAELDKAKIAGIRKAMATGAQSGLMYFIAYAANGLAFWQGSKAVASVVQGNSSGISVGAIFTVIFVVVDATVSLSQVSPFLQIFAAASAAFSRLEKEIQRNSHIDTASPRGTKLTQVHGALEFCAVSFNHPSRAEVPVLKRVSLQIPAGKHTAIVGPSGSGKSTITGLILRLYDPNSGTILLDGQELSQINVQSLRGRISLAQQEGHLLDRSILENIAHGLVNSDSPQVGMIASILEGPTMGAIAERLRSGQDIASIIPSVDKNVAQILKSVIEAAELAQADGFVQSLQNTYGTMVGPAGKFLSGGQRQRVSLARALIKSAPILILDEATSALDSDTERRVTTNVKKLTVGKTLVSVAHRLSTIYDADKIIVMNAGEIAEEGNHEELMTANGLYANMVRLQSLEPLNDGEVIATTAALKSLNDSTNLINSEKTRTSSLIEEHRPADPARVSDTAVIEENAMTEDDDAGLSATRSLHAIDRVFSPIVRPYLWIIFPALIATTVVGAAFTIEAVIFGNTVKSLSPCNTPSSIASRGSFYGLMFFVLAIAEFFANFASWSFFGRVSECIVHTTRLSCFRMLFRQDLQWHQSSKRTPSLLLNFITRDGDQLAGLSGSVLGVIFSIGVNLIVSIVLTIAVAWKIALVCLAIVPLFLGIGIMQIRVVAQFEECHESAYTTSVSIGVEAVSNIKTIASLSLEDNILAMYRRTLAVPRKETTKATFHANVWLALAYFVGNLGYALAFWWGGKQIVNGAYSQVQFLIVVFSLLVSAQLWSGMFALAPEISSAKAALGRISSLLSLEPRKEFRPSTTFEDSSAPEDDLTRDIEKRPRSTGSSSLNQSGIGVSFRDVSFSYPSRPGARVLDDISLSILPGQFCALVGTSGAGKSTIISLIERLYTPVSGSIHINGRDITKTESVSFRDDIAYVPQDSALFDGSITFNIGLGARPNSVSSDTEIQEACKLVHVHETIIDLPQGYSTRVGSSGGQLSGGQRQRLAIARALVRKPRLLILDEPTSALDAETESVLQEGLDRVMRETGMTVIVIAHRLRSIRRADMIYMLDRGRVVGKGTHDELLKDNPVYRQNVLSQTIDA